mmetsp:Transcript_12954/g.23723  ORF Transcript_12954/g.23723 Transcript_12954/m.23723 type:complete len:310 (+) Transcript_12954:1146-2075(+)
MYLLMSIFLVSFLPIWNSCSMVSLSYPLQVALCHWSSTGEKMRQAWSTRVALERFVCSFLYSSCFCLNSRARCRCSWTWRWRICCCWIAICCCWMACILMRSCTAGSTFTGTGTGIGSGACTGCGVAVARTPPLTVSPALALALLFTLLRHSCRRCCSQFWNSGSLTLVVPGGGRQGDSLDIVTAGGIAITLFETGWGCATGWGGAGGWGTYCGGCGGVGCCHDAPLPCIAATAATGIENWGAGSGFLFKASARSLPNSSTLAACCLLFITGASMICGMYCGTTCIGCGGCGGGLNCSAYWATGTGCCG